MEYENKTQSVQQVDYNFLRHQVIEKGIAEQQRALEYKISKLQKDIQMFEEKGLDFENENDFFLYQQYIELMSTEEGQMARKVNRASYERRKRCRKRILRYQLSNKAVFGTLTLSNEVLEKISEETFRKYVQRYMKNYFVSYIANVDYGSQNERIHYHVVGVPKDTWYDILNSTKVFHSKKQKWTTTLTTSEWQENYGFDYWEILADNDSTPGNVAKYIDKLTNHAFKESTKQSSIIYSRGDYFEHLEELKKLKF